MAKQKSDIDICVIMNTNNKRLTLTEMLTNIDYNVDLDIIIYTSTEWNKYKDNKANFANIIRRTGVNLYG